MEFNYVLAGNTMHIKLKNFCWNLANVSIKTEIHINWKNKLKLEKYLISEKKKILKVMSRKIFTYEELNLKFSYIILFVLI